MRVILINYSETLITSLKDFLEAFLDISIVGAFRNADTALDEIPSLDPDIVIVDLNKQTSSGTDIVCRLRGISPDLAIIAIAAGATEGYKETILRAGANAYIPKAKLTQDLVPAVHQEMSRLSGKGNN